MKDFPVTIYHNPRCGTSRKTVEAVRDAGFEPEIVEYLQTGWTRPQLAQILDRMGARPRDIVRDKGTNAAELGLLDPATPDDRVLDAMVADPILVNRPIVVTPRGARLCRPVETVLDLLPSSGRTDPARSEDAQKG